MALAGKNRFACTNRKEKVMSNPRDKQVKALRKAAEHWLEKGDKDMFMYVVNALLKMGVKI